ncbi:hypothetical protein ABZS96_33730 [Streptomyces avermitilis]|uniref:hypothetical protein n=1 Tax=Streptomyces avermitilis TaxID=33903 RepID=UPI0033B115CE
MAWPRRKFFNTIDHARGLPYAPPLPTGPFRIYDKVDGSLGLVFVWRGQWRVVTTGAFDSPQARWARRHLSARDTSALAPGITYIAEIVYPDNRVVVDYRGRHDLVLLAAPTAPSWTWMPSPTTGPGSARWYDSGPRCRSTNCSGSPGPTPARTEAPHGESTARASWSSSPTGSG